MHVVHVSRWHLPVRGYGGIPRVLYWLAKAQAEQGDRVTILGPPGSSCPGTICVPVPMAEKLADYSAHLAAYLPRDADIVHLHTPPAVEPPLPWVFTAQGNSPGELEPHPNKIYISRDHARRGGGSAFVHNGIDPAEFVYRERKDDYFLFLSRVSRRVKGVDVALRLARELGFRLVVAGGTRFSLRKTGGLLDSLLAKVRFCGDVDGQRKAELLAGARALIFPIRWEEPFGLVVAEALMSGTPVITTPRGSMPELIPPEVGFLCDSYESMADAIRRVGEISPAACRRHAMEHFTNHHAADGYRRYYREAIASWAGSARVA